MREVNAKQITEVVKKMCIDSNYYLTEDVLRALDEGEKKEESPVGKEVFQQISPSGAFTDCHCAVSGAKLDEVWHDDFGTW